MKNPPLPSPAHLQEHPGPQRPREDPPGRAAVRVPGVLRQLARRAPDDGRGRAEGEQEAGCTWWPTHSTEQIFGEELCQCNDNPAELEPTEVEAMQDGRGQESGGARVQGIVGVSFQINSFKNLFSPSFPGSSTSSLGIPLQPSGPPSQARSSTGRPRTTTPRWA